MNQVILFSPIGGTDPISAVNYRDGSMLHICRVYKPSKDILYMSAEVLDYHKKDNRYLYCLNRLEKMQERTMEYELIARPELKNVQEFDYFYQDFHKIFEKIFNEKDVTDTIIVNVSSGTPAMKSGLLVLQTLGEFPCKMVQVATPEQKMNEHSHKGYDVEVAWDLNEDNEEGFENRCKEIQCPTLSAIKKEEIIKKHLSVYDYRAAVSVAKTMPDLYTRNYFDYLRLAESRLLLDFSTVDKIIREKDYQCLPIRESGKRKCFEYALSLQIKLWREEYADFIRGITPLIVDLLEMALKYQCKIDINKYCRIKSRKIELKNKSLEVKTRVWDMKKLQGTPLLEALDKEFGCFRGENIYSVHLQSLIHIFSKNYKMIGLAKDLTNVEGRIRNMAAHEIVSITEDTIVERTELTGKQIMEKIKEMFNFTGIKIKSNDWNSYNDMNDQIICKLGTF